MNDIWILAQQSGNEPPSGITSTPVTAEETTTTVASDPNASVPVKAPPKSPLIQYLFPVLIIIVMYLIFFGGPRKKQQEHRKMVQSLEKNDRVRTIGGIIGTIVDIKDDEITLKIDESNNTKIKVVSSAIGKNLSKDKS
jgi:preprotein translocase subunit YajC